MFITTLNIPRTPRNVFAQKGKQFNMYLFSMLRRKDDPVKATECLDCLSMRPRYSMWYYAVEDIGIGEKSFFCVRPNVMLEDIEVNGLMLFEKKTETDLLKAGVKVEPSPMGAWQIYLLISTPSVLPSYWQGECDRCISIFSYATLREVIPPDIEVDDDFFTKHDLMPKVTQQGNKFYVSCCYWSVWTGLVRETVYFRFNGHTITTIRHKEEDDEVIIPYNCGILY